MQVQEESLYEFVSEARLFTVNSKIVVGEATHDSPDRKYLSQTEEKTHVLTLKFQKTFYKGNIIQSDPVPPSL